MIATEPLRIRQMAILMTVPIWSTLVESCFDAHVSIYRWTLSMGSLLLFNVIVPDCDY
jgi:hypothetical protein